LQTCPRTNTLCVLRLRDPFQASHILPQHGRNYH
jgi:hypothetical protein